MSAWDLKFVNPASSGAELAHAAQAGVQACASMQALCNASDLIISAVTASNTLAVAQQAAVHVRAGSVFLDFNSASPGTKQQCSALIEARSLGGRRNVGCKLTAAVYFSPISCQISRYSAAKLSKTIPSLAPIFAQTPSAAQAPSDHSDDVAVRQAVRMHRCAER